MKRLLGIALLFALIAGVAQAGASGGVGGGGTFTVYYDSVNHIFYIGNRGERFDISPSGSYGDSGYCMDDSDFARLQGAVYGYKTVDARCQTGGTRSYRVTDGDQPQQAELIDRRGKIRDGVSKSGESK